ncbi:MAG: hypothetical protein VYD77_03185 [Actinomycetota bacterium]|nr:hypothetical protein [Actinomycetota bacterium]
MEEFEVFQNEFNSGNISQSEYWKHWRTVWNANKGFASYFNGDIESRDEILGEIFSRYPDHRDSFMTRSERKKLLGLPRSLTVFRGGQQSTIAGWSWTLERERAEHFARSGATDGRPLLAIAYDFPSSAILAYLSSDGYSEVIIDPFTITIESAEFSRIHFERIE